MITDAQARFYADNGYLVVPALFDREQVGRALQAIDQLLSPDNPEPPRPAPRRAGRLPFWSGRNGLARTRPPGSRSSKDGGSVWCRMTRSRTSTVVRGPTFCPR